jgi:hypothetical protein
MSLIKSTARKPSSHHAQQHKGNQPFFAPQTKLEVGKPGDKYEREADAVAEQVVQKQAKPEFLTPTPFFNNDNPFFPPAKPKQAPLQKKEDRGTESQEIQEKPLAESITPKIQFSAPAAPPTENSDENCVQRASSESLATESLSETGNSTVQTKCAECEKQEKQNAQLKSEGGTPVQAKCDSCSAKESLAQMKEMGAEETPLHGVESSLQASRGGGSPMDDQTRSSMERGFGADFSGVKIHTGSEAVQMNKELGSHAFTSGNDIYFNEGKYDPASKGGQTLLAHELTHTVQQGASSTQVQKSTDTPPKDEKGKDEEAKMPNPNAPTGDPFFEPTDREKEQTPNDFKNESQSAIKNQMAAETGQAESEVPVKAKIEEGEPTRLEPESPINPQDQKIEMKEEQGESPEEGEAAVQDAIPEAAPAQQGDAAAPAADNTGNPASPKTSEISTPEQQPLPEIGQDETADAIRQKGQEEPTAAEIEEVQNDTRSDEEKQAEQAQLAAQFTAAHAASKQSIEQKIETEISTVRAREATLSELIRQRTISTEAEIMATIASKKAELQAGYALARQQLAAGKEADFARLEASKQAKIEILTAEMESRRVSFGAFVDEQTNMPTQNANNEADRADRELEAAAVQALAEGESVAGRHPKSDDGHPEARDSVRQIARETAADLRSSKATIRTDLLNAASEFNGGFENYRTDILSQIDSTEQQLQTGINDSVESFKEVINSAYESVLNSLETKETTELQQLDELQARQLEANRSNEETALETVQTSANTAAEELQRVGSHILEMLDTLGNNTSELLTPGEEIPLLSAMREMQQSCLTQLQSLEQDGITQLEAITAQTMESLDQADTGNVDSNASFVSATLEQASALITNSNTQRESSLNELRTTLDTSFTGMEGALDQMRTEALAGLDTAIEERKGKILQANDEFLTELRSQNDEHIETAKQPLTDPLIGRLWSAADRATASWWEGMLAAIGDFLLMLIILVVIAAILVALGVFSTITGALLVIGAVLLAAVFIVSLIQRISQGNGLWSLPLAIADTLGITMIYQGITNKDIATGNDLRMSPFDQWYSGTTGVLQFVTIILPFKSRIPGLRNIKMPRIFGEPNGRGPAGMIGRGIRWVEGIGRSFREWANGGKTPERAPIGDRIIDWAKSLWPGRRNNPNEPTTDPTNEPTTEPTTEPTNEPTTNPLRGRRPATPEEPVLDQNGNLTEYGQWYYEKPPFRDKAALDTQVWNGSRDSNGVARGPNGEQLSPSNWKVEPRPGRSITEIQQQAAQNNWSRKQFMDEYNNPSNYRATVRDPLAQFSGDRPASPAEPVIDPNTGELTPYGRWYYERPSGFRNGVRDRVWQDAQNSSIDGKVRDPLTGQEMDPNQPWDMGHRYGFEFRKHQASAARRGISRDQFINEHNDPSHFRPEIPSSNQGHAGEAPDGVYHGP